VNASDRAVYATAPAAGVRALGLGLVGLGFVVLISLPLLAAEPPQWVSVVATIVLALSTLTMLVIIGTAVARIAGRGPRLVLDADAFENRTGVRVGVRRATWREVKHVRAHGRTLVIELTDGRQSLVDTSLLATPPRDIAADLRDRLNASRGYRKP
jgi:hypothetical protein